MRVLRTLAAFLCVIWGLPSSQALAAGLNERRSSPVSDAEGRPAYYTGGPEESAVLASLDGIVAGRGRYVDDADPKPVEAAPSVDKVEVAVPTFCEGYSGQLGKWIESLHKTKGFFDAARLIREAPTPQGKLQLISWAACDRRTYAPRQRAVAAWLQTWLNENRLSLATARKHLGHYARTKKAPLSHSFESRCDQRKEEPSRALLCPEGADESLQYFRELDKGLAQNPVRHLVLIKRLRRLAESAADQQSYWFFRTLAAFESKSLSFATFDNAVDTLKIEDSDERLGYSLAYARLTSPKFKQPAMSGQVPANASSLDEIATKAAEGWSNQYEAEKPLIDRAHALLGTLRDSDSGCLLKTRALLADALIGAGVRSLAQIKSTLETPAANMALALHHACALASASPEVHFTAEALRGAKNAYWGKHFAVATAISNALGIKNPLGPVTNLGGPFSQGFLSERRRASAVKPDGENVLIFLEKDVDTAPILSCKRTGRIERIREDGVVEYEEECVQTGTRQVLTYFTPIRVAASEAHGIKPGSVVSYVVIGRLGDEKPISEPAPGAVVAVYPTVQDAKKDTNMLSFLGIRLSR